MSRSRPDSARELLRRITSLEGQNSPRVLLLAAHPDDETIGASAILEHLNGISIAYLTDGAPRDRRFWPSTVNGTRESYAALRAEEANGALRLVGVTPDRVRFLGGIDQESIFDVPGLLDALLNLMRDLQPAVIVTHPYEGGHPDHDTAALVAHLAVALEEQAGLEAPTLLEMTSYHACESRRVAGEFLPGSSANDGSAVTLNLSHAELANKSRMLACYVSQRAVLSDFPLQPERLRVAPAYDFTHPPHEGLLWYECLQWPLTGRLWRDEAIKTLERCWPVSCR
jgi:LmbE family N-acetylglucosaminyl deacetylase